MFLRLGRNDFFRLKSQQHPAFCPSWKLPSFRFLPSLFRFARTELSWDSNSLCCYRRTEDIDRPVVVNFVCAINFMNWSRWSFSSQKYYIRGCCNKGHKLQYELFSRRILLHSIARTNCIISRLRLNKKLKRCFRGIEIIVQSCWFEFSIFF